MSIVQLQLQLVVQSGPTFCTFKLIRFWRAARNRWLLFYFSITS